MALLLHDFCWQLPFFVVSFFDCLPEKLIKLRSIFLPPIRRYPLSIQLLNIFNKAMVLGTGSPYSSCATRPSLFVITLMCFNYLECWGEIVKAQQQKKCPIQNCRQLTPQCIQGCWHELEKERSGQTYELSSNDEVKAQHAPGVSRIFRNLNSVFSFPEQSSNVIRAWCLSLTTAYV